MHNGKIAAYFEDTAALTDDVMGEYMNGLMGTSYPVFRGAEKPLLREAHAAAAFHGRDGLGDVPLPEPPHENRPEKAWDALYNCAREHPGELNLIATGPLTNAAVALAKYPELRTLLRQILFMPSITICTFLSLTNSFKLYDQNLALTNGSPFKTLADGSVIKTTEMLALNIVNSNTSNTRGPGQAKAVVFFILVAAIGLIQLTASRNKEVQQ